MTNTQKNEIIRLRDSGKTYAEISKALGLSMNTVKSYCLRNGIGGEERKKKKHCVQCRKPMKNSIQPSRRFCGDACRMDWWQANPKKLNKKAFYHFTCPVCKKPFTAYGNANRKYCSRKCYGKSKAVRHD